MLRDHLVCRINHEQLQRCLLAEPNLCFSKAMEIARTFESAVQDARHFQEGPKQSQPLPVNALQKGATATTLTAKNQCYRCGGSHKASSCTFKESTCHHCKKKGHLAKMCQNHRDPTTTGKSTTKGMHQVTLDDDGTQDDVYRMYNLLGPQTNPIQVTVSIENQDVLMAGALLSVISETTHKLLSSVPPLQPTQAKLCTYTGESLGVLGSISVSVQHNEQQKQ